MKLKLGTRGSDLALTQSRWVAAELARAGIETELVVISTSGDRSDAPSFGAIGPQGVFVREIEQALIEGRVDFAVHSYKDLPTASPAGLVVAATPARRDVADWLLYRSEAAGGIGAADVTAASGGASASGVAAAFGGASPSGATAASGGEAALIPLRAGARVGTSSARRQAWLRHFRPDLDIAPLRGNVPTRVKRLASGDFDAIVLAGAGIERLDEATDVLAEPLTGLERHRLDPERFVPAPAQGALALQCRSGTAADRNAADGGATDGVADALAAIGDEATDQAVTLERHALALAEGGCDAAFGAWARPGPEGFELSVMIEGGGRVAMATVAGPFDTALAARAMRKLGAARPGSVAR